MNSTEPITTIHKPGRVVRLAISRRAGFAPGLLLVIEDGETGERRGTLLFTARELESLEHAIRCVRTAND